MYYLKYLNYKLYMRFKEQDGSELSARWSAMLIVPTLLIMNISTLIICHGLFVWGFETHRHKTSFLFSQRFGWSTFIVLYISNYFLVYFNKRYIRIFSEFNRIDMKSRFSNIYLFIYFFLSMLSIPIVFLIEKYIRLGYLESPF